MNTDTPLRYRYESFGGIIASEDPPFLAHVDRQYMRELDLPASPLWERDPQPYLSAPTEVHFAVTNRCSAGCRPCYMDSTADDAGDLPAGRFKEALDRLKAMGVFHVALGGGEAFERDDLIGIARYARSIGLVPNLTTNGFVLDRQLARECTVFGQVNVSLDGIGARYREVRGIDGFDRAHRGIALLREAGIRVGINCLVSRVNFEHLGEVTAYAKEHGLQDVELLRYKPSGRGADRYDDMRLTDEQHRGLYPLLKQLHRRDGIPLKVDCSFVPMLCWHRPRRRLMERLAVYGCEAGNVLVGVRADGAFAGCSFLQNDESVFDLAGRWDTSPHLQECRSWGTPRQEPCASCDYADICRGGCHAVAAFVTGDAAAPDPECPWVVAHTGR